MGSVGETVEDIMAEEEDQPGFIAAIFATVGGIISGYGWYILAGGAAAYYAYKNYGPKYGLSGGGGAPKGRTLTAAESADFQRKEEARLRYIAKLQEQYEKDAILKAEKDKQREEEKRKARLEELERLEQKSGGSGNKLGDSLDSGSSSGSKSKPKSAQSFRPEYNPLMGDIGSYRPSTSRSSGRAGG